MRLFAVGRYKSDSPEFEDDMLQITSGFQLSTQISGGRDFGADRV